jgi:hypothetical protein
MATSNNNTSIFLQKLTSYPVVKYSFDATLFYYKEAKEKNTFVKKGLELAETSVGSLAASPLVVDVSKKCEPLLQKADQFGCYQLEQAETRLFKPAVQMYASANQAISSSRKVLEERVEASKKVVGTVVQPIATTYQHLVSLPAVLTNRVLDFAENSVGYYLPEEQEIQEEHTEGTWARSRALSHKAYHRAQRKAYHQVEQAKLYSESVITKYPLAVNAVNFVKTRDPEIKQNIVQQLTTTVSYYTEKTKGFIAENTVAQRAATYVKPLIDWLPSPVHSLIATFLTTMSLISQTDTQQTSSLSTSEEVVDNDETSGPIEPEHTHENEDENETMGENERENEYEDGDD